MNRSALIVTIVPAIAIAALLYAFSGLPWTPLRVLGLVLTLAGLAALTISRVQLGNSFTVTPQARALVTHGIYSRIRNPIYVFSAMAIAGLLLYLDRPKFLWILLILIPLQFIRARQESQVLEARFGDSYRQYKSQTWF
jgi:protein-S-isoprenylcysteine O-methyltransferase Ste14